MNENAYWKKACKHASSSWDLQQARPAEQQKIFLNLLAIGPEIRSYNQ